MREPAGRRAVKLSGIDSRLPCIRMEEISSDLAFSRAITLDELPEADAFVARNLFRTHFNTNMYRRLGAAPTHHSEQAATQRRRESKNWRRRLKASGFPLGGTRGCHSAHPGKRQDGGTQSHCKAVSTENPGGYRPRHGDNDRSQWSRSKPDSCATGSITTSLLPAVQRSFSAIVIGAGSSHTE